MITTNTQLSKETLEALLAKDSMISVDMHDVRKMFGEGPKLRMMQIAGNTIDEVVAAIQEEFAALGGCPKEYVAVYVSMCLKMSDLEILSELTDGADRYKRTIIFETDPAGEIVLYFFFE